VKAHDRPRHPAHGLTRRTSEGTSTALGPRPRTAALSRCVFEYAWLEGKPNLGFVLPDGHTIVGFVSSISPLGNSWVHCLTCRGAALVGCVRQIRQVRRRCPNRYHLMASSSLSSPQNSSFSIVNVGEPKIPSPRAASVSPKLQVHVLGAGAFDDTNTLRFNVLSHNVLSQLTESASGRWP
jgi:hypothetical protein